MATSAAWTSRKLVPKMADQSREPEYDKGAVISEDFEPGTEKLFEILEPAKGLASIPTAVVPPPTHDQKTRKQIAFFILSMIGIFYAAILWCFLAGWIENVGFTTAITAFSGMQALAAAAIGFYYGSKQE